MGHEAGIKNKYHNDLPTTPPPVHLSEQLNFWAITLSFGCERILFENDDIFINL